MNLEYLCKPYSPETRGDLEEYLKKYAMDNADLHEKLALQRNEDLKKVGNNAKAKEAIWATYYKKVNDLDQNFHMSIDISDRFSIVKLQDTLDESVNRFSVSKEKMKEISEKTDFSITGHTANLQLQVDQTLYDSAIDLSQKLLDEKIDKLNKNREINMATNLEILKSDKATAGEKMKAMEELNQNLLSLKFDRFRKIRNGLNYYGKSIQLNEAKEIIEELNRVINEIKQKFIKK